MWDPNGSEVGQVGPTCSDESHLGPMWASCQGVMRRLTHWELERAGVSISSLFKT